MRNKTRVLLIVTIIIGISFFIMSIPYSVYSMEPQFVMQRCTEENEINFSVWENEKEDYIVFLPGFVDLQDLKIHLNTDSPIYINDILLAEGLCCDIFEINQTYEVVFKQFGKTYTRNISFQQSGGVSTMFIETETGSMDYIHAKKGNEEKGSIRIYTEEGIISYTGDLEFIKGRGNYTWTEYEKKPYSIKLSEEADLLGMGKAQKWILLANAGDQSNLRNKIVYDFADELGLLYSPESEWVDLYLNGEYVGLYQLSEKNEVHSQRVNIAQNGSFLVSLELENRLKSQDYDYVLTEEKQAFRVHYPENPSKENLVQIETQLQAVETAILSDNGIDPLTGQYWNELIDLDSWVKKYLIEEIFGNGDGGAVSQFYYYDANDFKSKIYAGPVWDYDSTMGNPTGWHLLSAQTFYANRLCVGDGYNTPWLYHLYQKEEFYEQIVEVYKNQCISLLENLLSNQIYNYADQIEQATMMNAIRWLGNEADIFIPVNNIVSYLEERVVFLNKVWLEERDYHQIQANQSFGSHYAHYIVFDGEKLEKLPEFEDTQYNIFQGWYCTDSDEPFDSDMPITEDLEIYAKWGDSLKKRTEQIAKIIPLCIIGLMGLIFLVIDVRRSRKGK